MRLLSVLVLVVLEYSMVFAGGGDGFTRSLSDLSFDRVDYSVLTVQLESRESLNGRSRLDLLVQHNLKYLYHHKMNRARFLVAPDPQNVIGVMTEIFESSNRIGGLIDQGSGMIQDEPGVDQMKWVVEEIGAEARDLKARFADYFVEGHNSRFEVVVPKTRNASDQFRAFLRDGGRINRQLESKLDGYFLADSPGAVRVSDYSSSSIGTLVEALNQLSRVVLKEMRRLD